MSRISKMSLVHLPGEVSTNPRFQNGGGHSMPNMIREKQLERISRLCAEVNQLLEVMADQIEKSQQELNFLMSRYLLLPVETQTSWLPRLYSIIESQPNLVGDLSINLLQEIDGLRPIQES